MVELTTEQFEAAKVRGDALLRGPHAERAHYKVRQGRIIVRLITGAEISFDPKGAKGLQHAKQRDLEVIEVDALGLGIYFPRLDADLYAPALYAAILESDGEQGCGSTD